MIEKTISVIIPTYMEERYIENCLKSIKNQDFPQNKIETIVVDSNSNDKTRIIAEKYVDKVINIDERGVGRARNFGAKQAKSGILLFLDVDTILHPKFISELIKTYQNSDFVCISGFIKSLPCMKIKNRIYGYFHYRILNMTMYITSLLNYPLFSTICCSCKKSVFNKIRGFDEKLAVGEDVKFSLKIKEYGKCSINRKSIAYSSLRRTEKLGIIGGLLVFFKNYYKMIFLKQTPWVNDFPHIE